MKFMSKDRAMSVLGVSRATLYRYMQSGKLRPAFSGRSIGVWDDEVYSVKRVIDDPLPMAFDKLSFAQVLARLTVVETRLAVVCRILDIKYEPLGLTDSELRMLHETCGYSAEHGWPPQVEEQMADTFVRMRLEDLERLEEATKDEHPWRPFLRLARTMHARPYTESLRDQFSAGVANLVAIGALYTVLKGESPKAYSMLMEKDATPDRRLLRKLAKTDK